MNQVERFLTGVSAIWASVKTHDLASLLFAQLYGSPSISLTINGSVIGNVAFAMMMLTVTLHMIRKEDYGRRSVFWLLTASFVLGAPIAVLQGLVGITAAKLIAVLALAAALLVYFWTIWSWSKERPAKFRARILGTAAIVLLLIVPIGISWAAAYTGVLK